MKVLDFGLAKALEPVSAGSTDATASPTITSPAMMTRVGVILGTAAYMSPEQAKGRAADRRSDVWAFGCVLYEMLTGKRAFEGEDVSDTLAAVLRGEPDWSGLATNVPPAMVILIKRCLQKDRRERIGGMSAARFVLFETDLVVPASRASDASIGGVFARYPAAAAAVLFLAGAIAAAAIARSVMQPPAVASQPVARFAVPLGPDQQFSVGGGFPVVALSPTGTDIVYVANNALYLRPLDRLEATSIRGIEGKGLDRPAGPFFSPDGQWIGFWQSGYLKKASVTGGAPAVVYKADFPFGASWEEDDTIIFGAGADGIWRVRSDGGQAENLIKVDLGQYARGPQLLPGGRTLVFTLLTSQSGPAEQASQNERAPGQRLDQLIWDDAQVVVQSLDTGERRVLIEGATDARYAPSGHLVFASRGSVFAVPFDATNLAVTGGRVTVAENVAHNTGTGAAHFTFSRTGSFAYVSGSFSRPSRGIAWVDRQGRESPINAPPRAYMYPRVSPDGTRLAVTIDGPQQDIWILDLTTGGERLTRLTSDPADDRYNEWTPDGRHIVFGSRRGGTAGLWRQPANGGAAERLAQLPDRRNDFLLPSPISLDGGRIVPTLVFRPEQDSLRENTDLYLLTLGPPAGLAPLLQTSFSERSAEISPDGRWLAYQSNESGQYEIYVGRADMVKTGERSPVSSGGGQHAVWAPNGRELFYAKPSGGLMRVTVESGSEWKASKPTQLIDGSYNWTSASGFGGRMYDVSRDGQRFLVLKPVESAGPTTIVVVQNWLEELKQRVPAR